MNREGNSRSRIKQASSIFFGRLLASGQQTCFSASESTGRSWFSIFQMPNMIGKGHQQLESLNFCPNDLDWFCYVWVKCDTSLTWTTPKPSQSPMEPPTSERKLLKPGLTKSVLVTRTVEGNFIVILDRFLWFLWPETNFELVVKVLHGFGQSEVS